MPELLVIPTWANGPGAATDETGTGNGGYSAGLLAARLESPGGVCVDLRLPPPLGRSLRIEVEADGASLFDDSGAEPALVMAARPEPVSLEVEDVIRTIDPTDATTASAGFPFLERHPFPQCLACGTERPDDLPGLCLHCGPVPGVQVRDDAGAPTPVFADTWTPLPDLADANDPALASIAATWSALDCPSAAPFADPDAEFPSVLGRIAARIDERPRIGETYVLAAWLRAVDGRKRTSRSVLLDTRGNVLAAADALWIEVRPR